MKKLYTLSFLLAAGLSFAQTPIITGMLDGPCPEGTPKAIEIYADGTVNFAEYSLENQANANTTWGNTLSLAALGTVTNDFVYVVSADAANNFATEFSSIPATNILVTGTGGAEIPQPANINGDDRVRIINNGTMAVVDQFGEEGVDGTGTAWEHLDSWAVRANETGPNGAAFNAGNWEFGGVDALDGLGICMGGEALSTIVPFGQYVPAAASTKDFNTISGLKMFPNPLSGNILNIATAANAAKTVAIFDVLGKQVLNTKVNGEAVNVSGLTAGVYIVKITEEGKTATRKLVVK